MYIRHQANFWVARQKILVTSKLQWLCSVFWRSFLLFLRPNSLSFTVCLEIFWIILFVPECSHDFVIAYATGTILVQTGIFSPEQLLWDRKPFEAFYSFVILSHVFSLEFYSIWRTTFPWSVAIRPGCDLQHHLLPKSHKDLNSIQWFSALHLPLFPWLCSWLGWAGYFHFQTAFAILQIKTVVQ